jgi:hypothetical protein
VHLKHIVTFDQLQYFVAILCFLAGFFGYITYPLGLDLSIECAFPVTSEATCNGLIIISGHLQGLLFVGIIRGLSDNTLFENLPYFTSLMTTIFITTLIACVFILFFHTHYDRMRQQVRQNFDAILNSNSTQIGITAQPPPLFS